MSEEKVKMKDLDKWYNRNPQLEIMLDAMGKYWHALSYEQKLELYQKDAK